MMTRLSMLSGGCGAICFLVVLVQMRTMPAAAFAGVTAVVGTLAPDERWFGGGWSSSNRDTSKVVNGKQIRLFAAIQEENVLQDEPPPPTKKGDIQTKFVATRDVVSDPVPMPRDPQFLQDFFALKSHRDLLFPYEFTLIDSGTPSKEDINMASVLSKKYLPPLPDSSTELIESKLLEFVSPGISFPGIKVTSILKMSAQTLVLTGEQRLPEYRFVLLESTTKATGPKPIVWLFNKLTRAGETKEQSTFSCTRLSVEERGNSLVFHANARLEVQLNIPKVMIKLLPMKKEVFEEQGSKSLDGAMKDLGPSVKRFTGAYLKWLEL
jgi:hypothetical protein